MKRKFLYILFCAFTLGASAQTLSPSVLSTLGNSVSAGGSSLSGTMGQTYTTTLPSAGNSVTQGFEQPNSSVTACSPPGSSAGATNFSSSSLVANGTSSTGTISFTRGTGTGGVIVIAAKDIAPNTAPSPSLYTCTGCSAFGSGTVVGNGYIVYTSTTAGNGTSTVNVNLSALTSGHSYHFNIYEYNTGFCYIINPLSGGFCIGAPSVPTSTPASNSFCQGSATTFNLTIPAYTDSTYYSFQWQSSATNGGPFSNVSAGGSTSTYTTPGSLSSSPVYYVCKVSCTSDGTSSLSSEDTDQYLPFYLCNCNGICDFYWTDGSSGITNVALNGNTIDLNRASQARSNSYPFPLSEYLTPNPDLSTGAAYTVSVTVSTGAGNTVDAWIDYDHSASFETSDGLGLNEQLATEAINVAANGTTTFTFTVPATALLGITAMEVREATGTTGLVGCTEYTSGTIEGQTNDYLVNIITCSEPATQASAFGFNSIVSNFANSSCNVTFTRGSGDGGLLVVAKQGSAPTPPTEGDSYTANSTFGSGGTTAAGSYVVYNSNAVTQGNTVTVPVTGLTNTDIYYFAAYEWNSAANCYDLASPPNGTVTIPICQVPATQANGFSLGAVTATTQVLNWSNNGNANGVIIVLAQGAAPTAPSLNTAYTADPNNAYGNAGAGYSTAAGSYVIYEGNATTVTVQGLATNTTYYYGIYTWNTATNCYNLTAPITGNFTTANGPMQSVNSVTEASTAIVNPGSSNQAILRVLITCDNGSLPVLNISNLGFTTAAINGGTTNVADIAAARVWYTGSSSTFATGTQFGTDVDNPNGALAFTGSLTLSPGANYFWLVYDINALPTSAIEDYVDAACTQINSTTLSSNGDPAGNREIDLNYCTFTAAAGPCSTNNSLAGHTFVGLEAIGLGASSNNLYNSASCDPTVYKNLSTSVSYTVIEGQTYNFSASIFNTASLATTNAAVYVLVDWNYSGAFLDGANTPNEQAYGNTITTGQGNTLTGTITIPTGLTPGDYRMRVICAQGGTPNACAGAASPAMAEAYDFTLVVQAATAPMVYSSFATTKNTETVAPGVSNVEIMGLQVITTGVLSPISLTSITFNTTGSSNPLVDLADAKIYYTGSSGTFAATNQFGTTQANPNGTITVTGASQQLVTDANFFWLVYDVSGDAALGDVLNAQVTSITVAGNTYNFSGTVANPAGEITIGISGTGLPILYYDFELNSNRNTTLELTPEQQVNTGNSNFSIVGTTYGQTGGDGGSYFSSPNAGSALDLASGAASSSPTVAPSAYAQVSVNTSGFTGTSVQYDVINPIEDLFFITYYNWDAINYSTDGGATWNILASYNGSGNQWYQRVIPLPSSCDNNPNLVFRIYGYDGNDFLGVTSTTIVDNFQVNALATTTTAGTKTLANFVDILDGFMSNTVTGNALIIYDNFHVTGGGTTVNMTSSNAALYGGMYIDNSATFNFGTGASPTYMLGTNGAFSVYPTATISVTDQNGISSLGRPEQYFGNVQDTGTRYYSAAANYNYVGASAQITGDGLIGANNLTINNSSGVGLFNNNITVTGTLNLQSGIFNLGPYNLTLASTGTLAGSPFTTSNMVQADGTGQYIQGMGIISSPTTFTLPVGDGTPHYTPAILTFASNSAAGNVGVNVTNSTETNMDNPATPYVYLTRYWTFSNTLSNYSYTGTFTYPTAELSNAALETSMHLSQWGGSSWSEFSGSSASSGVLTESTALTQGTGALTGDFTGRTLCGPIAPPTSGGNVTICLSSAPGTISASSVGNVIDWYDAPSAGNLLQSASNTYTTSTAGTYYAQARTAISGCISSSRTAVTLIINPLPNQYFVTGGLCVPADLGLSNSDAGINYTLQLNGVSTGQTIPGNGSPLDFGLQNSAGVYNIRATNTTTSCTDTMLGIYDVAICTATWTGSTSTDWFNPTNWNPQAVPNVCGVTVIIGSPFTYYPVITGTNVNVSNVDISSGASITLDRQTLTVCGNWSGGSGANATVAGTGSVIISGGSAQTIGGNTQFEILQIDNGNGVSLTSGANVSIATGLHLQHGQLDVSQATLELLSTSANNNSYIDDFTGGFDGTLKGSIKADRYIPVQGSNQHFVSSPVNSPSIGQIGAWGPDGEYVVPSYNCDETVSAYGSPYGSVFEYVDGHMPPTGCMLGNWMIKSAGNMTNALGYSAYLSGNTTLQVTGPANTGTMSVSNLNNSGYPTVLTLQGDPIESGWNLVGNPYPSAIDLTADRTNNGFGDQVQIWQTSGPYEGSWQALLITGDQGQVVIPPFQGFMVRRLGAGTGSYPFNQGERSRIANQLFYRTQSSNSLQLGIDYNGVKDMTTINFNAQATNSYDAAFDADKQDGSPGRPTLYTYMDASMWYAINTLPSLTQTAVVPMGLRPEANGTMTIAPSGIETFDPTTYIYLEDKQTGTMFNLRNGAYAFNTNKTDNQQRFAVHFTPPAQILTTDATCEAGGMINITQPGTAIWNYVLTDVSNTAVSIGSLSASSPLNINVEPGVYTLTLVDNTGYTVVKNIQVAGAEMVSAAFNSSANTALVQQNITFTANTPDAAAYNWSFSDGVTASGQTAVHSFKQEGIYNVMLNVNSSAGCTSSTTRSIIVTSRGVTGVNNLSNASDIDIWSNDNRVYIDFSKQSSVNADIEMYNELGQLVNHETFGRSALYSREITNLEAAYLIVKVMNANEVTTKKVFIINK